MTTLAVAEIFGPTLQGEGPSAGRLASFLRLGGCALACTWCDSDFTWNASKYDLRTELTNLTIDQVLEQIPDTGILVITGGEPLLQTRNIEHLIARIPDTRPVEVETAGTLPPPTWWPRASFNVSPKLAHSGNPTVAHPGWRTLGSRVRWKFVARTVADLDEIATHNTPPDRTWVMPEGTTPDLILKRARQLADPTIAHGWNLTLRTHTLLWGAEKGR